MDLYTFGLRLRLTRRVRGLTQRQLAGATGLSAAYLAHLEHGERSASLEALMSLCQALRVTPNDLLGVYPPNEELQKITVHTYEQMGRQALRLVVKEKEARR